MSSASSRMRAASSCGRRPRMSTNARRPPPRARASRCRRRVPSNRRRLRNVRGRAPRAHRRGAPRSRAGRSRRTGSRGAGAGRRAVSRRRHRAQVPAARMPPTMSRRRRAARPASTGRTAARTASAVACPAATPARKRCCRSARPIPLEQRLAGRTRAATARRRCRAPAASTRACASIARGQIRRTRGDPCRLRSTPRCFQDADRAQLAIVARAASRSPDSASSCAQRPAVAIDHPAASARARRAASSASAACP